MIRTPRTQQVFSNLLTILMFLATVILLSCTPRVEVAPPEKPITINLNVKIDHEIRVKVEKDLENVFTDQSGLF
ncbi:MAG: YnbE family lipoprotein [Nitrospirota bacterium]|nr:MAG: YnbE family lipoprotein [Nitrospirota bacterium]